MPERDEFYIRQCLDGHPDEYRHLVTRHQGAVLAFLRGRWAGRIQIDEVAQEAFIRAFLGLRSLRKQSSFLSWLLGIAHRVAQENHRRTRHEDRRRGDGPIEPRNPDVDSGREADRLALERAVAELSTPLREVVLLRFYSECSCSEIAERLHVPLGTVTKRLSRAYARIRHRLAI
jgi:RNA polymerase sigma-70 factor (ECF subfamily)